MEKEMIKENYIIINIKLVILKQIFLSQERIEKFNKINILIKLIETNLEK